MDLYLKIIGTPYIIVVSAFLCAMLVALSLAVSLLWAFRDRKVKP